MRSESLFVRNVVGRYPQFGILRSDNIVATVRQHGPVIRIRLDDDENPDAWLEITVELANTDRPREAGE